MKCKLNKKDDRSKDNFVPFNTRATNDYADRKATAFLLNRFMNPNEYQFFSYRGVEVDEELLAISDLINSCLEDASEIMNKCIAIFHLQE